MAKRIIISDEGERRAERVARFCEQHVRHMKDRWAGKPFTFEPWQYDNMIRPVYGQLDRKGRRKVKRALFGLPRWQGKSETCAALHINHLVAEPVYGGEQYAFATTRAQAAIIFETAKRMVNADPMLRAICKPYRNVIEVPETGCTFRALPFDADTSQGFHPSFATGDEVHVMKNLEMVESMVTGMVGREEGLFIAITTAAAQHGGALDELIDLWSKDPAAYIYWQGAGSEDDPTNPAVWRKANPASWITMDMLRSQFRALPLPVFQRLHLNVTPTIGANRAFPSDWWADCSGRPHFDPDRPTILGLDASLTRDTTALVMDQLDQADQHNTLAWVWGEGRPMGAIDHEAVEAKVVELCADYNVTRVVCDKSYFTRSMRRLQDEFRVPVEEYPQSSERMALASMTLYDILQQRRMAHGGDPELTSAVLNAGVKPTAYGWRITKVQDALKIDAAVALAMAAYIAEAESTDVAPSLAETGGIWTLEL